MLRRFPALALVACPAVSVARAQNESLLLPTDASDPAHGALRIDLLEASSTAAQSQPLSLALADGHALELRFAARESAWGGGWIWKGRVDGDPLGSATISVLDGVAIGSVRTGRELWAIEYAGHGLHSLRQVDEGHMPACAGAVPVPQSTTTPLSEVQHAPQQQSSLTGGATITVLVLYTSEARVAEGGTNAIQAKINLAVAEANQAYTNSQVTQQLALVYQGEASNYTESGDFDTELGRLQLAGDGYLDEAQPLRDQYCADLVALIVAGSQYCGIGYLMSTPSASFESHGYSVTSRICATGYYSFAHELGHNMGCHHDRPNAGSFMPAYPYAYGYLTSNGLWRTVMAYAPGTRIQFFSNPNVSYAGQALGVPEPSPVACENWKCLNNTADIVAGFRCPQPISYCTAGITQHGCTATISSTGSARASASSGFTLLVSGVEGQKQGLLFYGVHGRQALPWATGSSSFMCLIPPTQRLAAQNTGGTALLCDGSLSADWLAYVASHPAALGAPFSAGQVVQAQGWFRDPPSPKNTSLSDALEFPIVP